MFKNFTIILKHWWQILTMKEPLTNSKLIQPQRIALWVHPLAHSNRRNSSLSIIQYRNISIAFKVRKAQRLLAKLSTHSWPWIQERLKLFATVHFLLLKQEETDMQLYKLLQIHITILEEIYMSFLKKDGGDKVQSKQPTKVTAKDTKPYQRV